MAARNFFQVARDYGGPRREFFRLILAEIKEKYFDKGWRELLADDYYVVGVIMGRKQISSCVIELTFQAVLSTVPKSLIYTYFDQPLLPSKEGVFQNCCYAINLTWKVYMFSLIR